MATKTRPAVFVDSSAFIAFLDRSDTYFSIFAQAFAAPPALLTSALVVAECHAWFLRRYDRQRARQFLAFIRELPRLTILDVGATELAQSQKILDELSLIHI